MARLKSLAICARHYMHSDVYLLKSSSVYKSVFFCSILTGNLETRFSMNTLNEISGPRYVNYLTKSKEET